MIAKYSLRAITQTTYSRAITALLAASLAVLIDPIFRFNEYRALLHLLPVAGTMKFSGALTLVFLQVVALFYLILLLPSRRRRKTPWTWWKHYRNAAGCGHCRPHREVCLRRGKEAVKV